VQDATVIVVVVIDAVHDESLLSHAVTVAGPAQGVPTVRSRDPSVAINGEQDALSLGRRRSSAFCVPVAATAALKARKPYHAVNDEKSPTPWKCCDAGTSQRIFDCI
jgi:hypothetical protein